MNPTLILLRHGETNYNVEKRFSGSADAKLTENGKIQAINAGKLLANIPFYSVFTSTRSRAKDTMWTVIKHLNFKPTNIFENEQALDERNYGLLEGMTFAEGKSKFPPRNYKKWDRDYFEAPPMGESYSDVEERIVPFYKKRILPDLEYNRNVLVVSHSNAIRVLLGHLYQLDEAEIFNLNIENAMPIEIKANVIFKEYHNL